MVALALMGRAATLGGEIRHPEIRAAVEEPAADAQQFVATAISNYMANTSRWAWPAAETLHFLGLSDLDAGVTISHAIDVDGDTLTAAPLTQGANGTVTANPDGTVVGRLIRTTLPQERPINLPFRNFRLNSARAMSWTFPNTQEWSFNGTLSADGTAISGTTNSAQGGIPLTFRKR